MQKYIGNAQDKRGTAIVGASIYVTNLVGTIPLIYTDNGATVATNPLTTDSSGEYSFYAANGRYNLEVGAAGFATEAITDIMLYDPASMGADLVGFVQAGTGAVARTLQSKNRECVSVVDFGADITNMAAQNVTSFQAALNYANSIGGCKVLVPKGTYLLNAALSIYAKTILQGEGRQSSILSFSHIGDGIESTWPINSNTGVRIGLRDLALINTNASNTNGGFVDVGGTFVDVDNIYASGFKYGVIFDQTEIATIDRSEIISPAGGVGVWIVNGANHTPLAQPLFTNRITITRNQFNADAAALCNIADDGGANHSIRDNNFNAGLIGIRAACVYVLDISGNESEIHGTSDIYLCDTTLAGTYVGPCVGFNISSNELISGAGGRNIGIQNGQNGKISSNLFGQAASAINFLNGASNQATGNIIEGNTKLITGVGKTAGIFINGFTRSIRQNIIRQTAVTYSLTSAAAGTIVVTPASMEFISTGTRMFVVNADGSNGEDIIVKATTNTTFTADFISTKTTSFLMYGSTTFDQEEGAWTPTLGAGAVDGTHTYSTQIGRWSRRGNSVFLSGQIAISAKDAAISGNLQIKGLPFLPETATGMVYVANIGIYQGLTFGAGYTQLSGNVSQGLNQIDLLISGSGLGLNAPNAASITGTTVTLLFSVEYLTQS